jgi:hypothetical protein
MWEDMVRMSLRIRIVPATAASSSTARKGRSLSCPAFPAANSRSDVHAAAAANLTPVDSQIGLRSGQGCGNCDETFDWAGFTAD